MARLIDDYGGPLPTEPDSRGRPDELYGALVRSIAGPAAVGEGRARRSGASCSRASTAARRRPQEILADDPEALRAAAGFSRAKVAYLRSLAEHVLSGELEMTRIRELPDDEVIAELTAVKGIGEWTAQMFLMFTLHRPDVLPVGDLGVRNAAARRLRARRRRRRAARRSAEAVAPAPHARLPVPVALAAEHTGRLDRRPTLRRRAEVLGSDPARRGRGRLWRRRRRNQEGLGPDQERLGEGARRRWRPRRPSRRRSSPSRRRAVDRAVRRSSSTATARRRSPAPPSTGRRAAASPSACSTPQQKFTYGPTVVYVAPYKGGTVAGPVRRAGRRPADRPASTARSRRPPRAARSPPSTRPRSRSRKPGIYKVLAVSDIGGRAIAAGDERRGRLPGATDRIPDVGEKAPVVETDTRATVKGNLDLLDTRSPQGARARATSRSPTWSARSRWRCCSRRRSCASRASAGPSPTRCCRSRPRPATRSPSSTRRPTSDNDLNKGFRPPLERYGLQSEPWLFTVDRHGRDRRAARGLDRDPRLPRRRQGRLEVISGPRARRWSSARTSRSRRWSSPGARRRCWWSASSGSPRCGRGRGSKVRPTSPSEPAGSGPARSASRCSPSSSGPAWPASSRRRSTSPPPSSTSSSGSAWCSSRCCSGTSSAR